MNRYQATPPLPAESRVAPIAGGKRAILASPASSTVWHAPNRKQVRPQSLLVANRQYPASPAWRAAQAEKGNNRPVIMFKALLPSGATVISCVTVKHTPPARYLGRRGHAHAHHATPGAACAEAPAGPCVYLSASPDCLASTAAQHVGIDKPIPTNRSRGRAASPKRYRKFGIYRKSWFGI